MKFVRYSANDGLINNKIISICQDKYGFMWFGTMFGCCRFDGTEFKSWKSFISKKDTMRIGWVNCIVNDKENNIWLGLFGRKNTFLKFDLKNECFIDKSEMIKTKLNINHEEFEVNSIFIDNSGMFWLGGSFGVFLYNPKTEDVKTFAKFKNAPIPLDLSPITIKDFAEDTISQRMWIATSRGLYEYSRRDSSFSIYKNIPGDKQSLCYDYCNCVYFDSNNYLWVGTYNGLEKITSKPSGDLYFEHYSTNNSPAKSLSSNLIYDIVEDINRDLYIATVNGLCQIDSETKRIAQYFNNEIDYESINSNLVRKIFYSSNNDLWIATDAGVAKSKQKNFRSFSHSMYKNSVSHNKIDCFHEVSDSVVLIASPKGIDKFNLETSTFENILQVTKNEGGLYGAPMIMSPNSQNGIWIGTWSGGVSYFDFKAKKLTNYFSDPVLGKYKGILALSTDAHKNLWIGAQHVGVCVFDPSKNTCKNVNKNSLSNKIIYSILFDSDSSLWVGTRKGLNKLRTIGDDKFEVIINDILVHQIIEGKDGYIWVGTTDGLYSIDKKTYDIVHYNKLSGILNSEVLGLMQDEGSNLWLISENGLCKLSGIKSDDPQTTFFYKDDGLDIGDFLIRACYKLSDGKMLVGGTNGFSLFHPDDVHEDTVPPHIYISNLKLSNNDIAVGTEYNNQTVLKQNIYFIDDLSLNYRNNDFTLEFSAIHFHMPNYNKFAYKLEGYEENWNYVKTTERKAEYMNLRGGKYIFRVKAANGYGYWGQEKRIRISIQTPWWQTIWFVLFLTVVFISIIFVIVNRRTNWLRKQKIILEKKVESRTLELRKSNEMLNERQNELSKKAEELTEINEELLISNSKLEKKTIEVEQIAQKLHEADETKLRFFANISHEFRTPLTLILAPLDKYTKLKKLDHVNDWHKINTNLQLMQRNAKRLLRLINQIIDFRKIDHKQKKLKETNNNIIGFIQTIVEAFNLMAEAKNIHLSLNIQHSTFNKKHLPLNPQPQFNKTLETKKTSNEEDQLVNDKCDMTNDNWSMITDKCKMINDFWFDPDVMEKILYNLISNAIKYTPEDGEILIEIGIVETQCIASLQNQLAIEILDTGIGIKSSELDKIFDRFYRIDTNKNPAKEGSGIGLAYTKELVNLHKGTISVKSEWGKGTCFTLEFPIQEKMQPAKNTANNSYDFAFTKSMVENSIIQNPAPTQEENRTHQKTSNQILIVEDNEDMLNYISSEFANEYYIYKAQNGKQGIEIALIHNPDLIISDVMMPLMNGIELVNAVKNDEALCHIPVILLTAKTSDEDTLSGLKMGADDYMNKPFNIDILKAKVENIFNNRKILQQKFQKSFSVQASEFSTNRLDQKFLDMAIKTVEDNMSNPNFSLDEFIKKTGYSRTIVYKKMKSLTDQSVSDFIRNIKLKKAAEYLLKYRTEKTINEIAYMVGFKHRENFSRHFSAEYGMSPSEFRNSMQ